MSFLIGIASSILEWLLSKIFALIGADIKQAQSDQAAVNQAKQDTTNLKDAKTDDQKDNALQSVIDNSFH